MPSRLIRLGLLEEPCPGALEDAVPVIRHGWGGVRHAVVVQQSRLAPHPIPRPISSPPVGSSRRGSKPVAGTSSNEACRWTVEAAGVAPHLGTLRGRAIVKMAITSGNWPHGGSASHSPRSGRHKRPVSHKRLAGMALPKASSPFRGPVWCVSGVDGLSDGRQPEWLAAASSQLRLSAAAWPALRVACWLRMPNRMLKP